MKNKFISISRYLFLAAVLAFGFWYISGNYENYLSKANFTPVNISLLVALNLLTILIESFRLKVQMRKLGGSLSLLHSWHILTVIQAANHVILKAGTFSGGYYISKRYRISFHAYCALVITYIVIMTLGASVFGILITSGYMVAGVSIDLKIPAFFLMVIASCASFIGLASIRISLSRLPDIVRKLIVAWREIYSDYSIVLLLTGIEIFYTFVCALRFYVAVRMFSSDISFHEAVVVVTIGNFLRVASIVPGGIGVAEIASGWTAAFMGGDAGISGLSAGLDRLVYVSLLFVFGGIGFFSLSGRKDFHRPNDEDGEPLLQPD